MKRNLIVARCGEQSLHPRWLEGAEPDFDLVVTFYGQTVPPGWQDAGYEIHPIAGPKWQGLHQYLTRTDHWKAYERILLPDDDLLIDAAALNQFFDICAKLRADLAQPALDERSHFSWAVTLAHESFVWRMTNLVECMCPCLSPRLLERALPWFTQTRSGWGLDVQWADMLRTQGWGMPVVVDAVTLTHTRPVGAQGNGTGDPAHDPKAEMNAFLARLGLPEPIGVTLGGQLRTGEVLPPGGDGLRLAQTVGKDLAGKLGQMSAQQIADAVISQAVGLKLD
jgi:hypothetical protein